MSSTTATRDQFLLVYVKAQKTYNVLSWATPILAWHVAVHLVPDVFDISDWDDDERDGNRDDDLSNGLGNRMCNSLGSTLSKHEPTMQPVIVAKGKMFERKRENQLPTIDWDAIDHPQLGQAPIVKVYMIALPLKQTIHPNVQRNQETIFNSTKLPSTIRDQHISMHAILMKSWSLFWRSYSCS
jgi:hypothetical protein